MRSVEVVSSDAGDDDGECYLYRSEEHAHETLHASHYDCFDVRFSTRSVDYGEVKSEDVLRMSLVNQPLGETK